MKLAFLGAARTVTGSSYLVTAGERRVLVDHGMFQGAKDLRLRNWTPPAFDPRRLDHVVLTHSHLDHIGRLPRLVNQGFKGRVWCTPATRELAEVLLLDAAHLQMEDAEYHNRKGISKHTPALPLFDDRDVAATLPLFETLPLGERKALDSAFSFAFRDAGHLLGAASVDLRVDEPGRSCRILFSGDVGRFDAILTKDPALAPEADYVVMESTYGNRTHTEIPPLDQLEGVLQRTFARGGVLLIPAFAVGRAQQLIYLLDELVTNGRMRPFPIHVDSPMAADATRIYARYPEAHRTSLVGVGGRSLLYGKWVTFHRTRGESEALNTVKGPAVIISSSGMLSGGRILHHCRVRLPKAENTLLITGYQSEGTLGRALLDGAKSVRIHKGEVPVLAQVTSLKGMSGHGDAGEMVRWLSDIKKAPRQVFLTHGEADAALALAARIKEERGFSTYVPSHGEEVELEAGGDRVKAVICDIDGVVLQDNRALPGAKELVEALREARLRFVFLTNYPSQTPADIANRMADAGVEIGPEHFYTSAMATAEFLKNQAGHKRKAFVVGEGALVHAVYEAGFTLAESDVDFVVVGETRAYNFEMIQRAAHLINRGARFIATNPDVAGPQGRPSCGAFVAPIERITGKTPFYIGKPNAFMMRAALGHLGVHSNECWMVGDNMDTDIIAGVQTGLVTVLVLSGVSQEADLPRYAYRPDYIVKDAAGLILLLKGAPAGGIARVDDPVYLAPFRA